jgi:hypothetical protein
MKENVSLRSQAKTAYLYILLILSIFLNRSERNQGLRGVLAWGEG